MSYELLTLTEPEEDKLLINFLKALETNSELKKFISRNLLNPKLMITGNEWVILCDQPPGLEVDIENFLLDRIGPAGLRIARGLNDGEVSKVQFVRREPFGVSMARPEMEPSYGT